MLQAERSTARTQHGQGGDVSPSPSLGKGAAAAGATAGGRRGPEESALPFPEETTLRAVIAQPLHNFHPRCVPWEPDPRAEGVGKQAGVSSLLMLGASRRLGKSSLLCSHTIPGFGCSAPEAQHSQD